MPSESYISQSLLTASCLVMDHQCIVFASFSQPVIAGCCRIHVAGIFDSIIVIVIVIGVLFNLGRPLANMATFQGTQKSYYRHVMVTKNE